ncbi:MAG: DNA repair ATPase, partial [Catalinimonas sp.]
MAETPDTPAMERGTYEIIRQRLRDHGTALRERLQQLDATRREVFGTIETQLLSTERITTEHNCVPQDMVAVGDRLLFGYNVHMGLKTETHLSDVFSVYHYAEQQFHPAPLDLIAGERFAEDFRNLYKYYRDARFNKFAAIGPHLFVVFQTGPRPDDLKTFKFARAEGGLRYLDNRSDHEYVYPDQHAFRWRRATRDMHRTGTHPHVSIEDRVFVEAVGGDLTIKVEDNTDSGEGVYAEPVEHADQTLDDADIQYAPVGNLIVLRIRPFQEKDYRYIVYNEKLRTARRIDALADAAVLLPDDQGLLFPDGYYLQGGDQKRFDLADGGGRRFERRLAAPNGEDFLYVFYSPEGHHYALLSYNLIAQRTETPQLCHGYTLFDNGELILFRNDDQPKRHHALQIWRTPFVGPNEPPPAAGNHYLFKLGNREVVRAMAEANELLQLLDRDDNYAGLYLDLTRGAENLLDTYPWLNRPEAAALDVPTRAIREAARAAVDEFEKVQQLREAADRATLEAFGSTEALMKELGRRRGQDVQHFVEGLQALRTARGELIALKELRYVDEAAVDAREVAVSAAADKLARAAVRFLLEPDALAPYAARIEALSARAEGVEKGVEAQAAVADVDQTAADLDLLIEVVSNLKIDDATQTTRIIDGISALYARLNQVRAALKRRRQALLGAEGRAAFAAQLKLLDQSVAGYLDVSTTPARCDEYLNKLLVQLEELEGRFAEFDEFVEQLAAKREEVYGAFESRKVSLTEARRRRADALLRSAERILSGVRHRVSGLETAAAIHGYFAADLMVDKVRDVAGKLRDLGDAVRADDLLGRLQTAREEA